MSKALITEQLITDIADSIRDKTGSTDKMTPAEMPEKIKSITAISVIKDGDYFFAYGARSPRYFSSDEDFINFLKQLKFETAKNICYDGGISPSRNSVTSFLENLDVSNVKTLEGAFMLCYGAVGDPLESPIYDFSAWNTSKCTNMSGMFAGGQVGSYYKYTPLRGIEVGENFDTSNVTNFSSCFNYTSSAGGADVLVNFLNKMDTSSATSMSFFLSNHRTEKYNNVRGTFPEELDLSHFNLEKCGDASYMFYNGYTPTKKFIMKNMSFPSGARLSYMFSKALSRPLAIDLSGWSGNELNLGHMFESTYASELDLSTWRVSASTFINFLASALYITTADLSGIDISGAESVSGMLSTTKALTSLKLPSGDPKNITSILGLAGGTALTKLNLSKWTLSNCKDIEGFAKNSTNLSYVSIGNDNTTWIVTDTYNAFYGCSALETLIIRGTNVMTNSSTTTFTNSGIAKGTGYIYVADDLVDSYKTATNWSVYADQIKPLSEAPAEPEV